MGVKLILAPGTKLTVDTGFDFFVKKEVFRPDVLNDPDPEKRFQNKEAFQAWVPQISYNYSTKKVYVDNLGELTGWLSQNIELYNIEKGWFTTSFTDKRLFQVGVVITKHHRSPLNNKTKKKQGRRITPWIDDGGVLRPLGAAVAWQGLHISHLIPQQRIKFTIDWSSGEVKGFEKVVNCIKNKDWNIYLGIIFRIRNPYTNEFITTKPSSTCVCRTWEDAAINETYFY